MYDDQILWNGLLQGDRDMFLALYKKYYHSLLFIGLNKAKDPELVKDAIQQQFIYLWEKRTTIQAASNVKNYLITSLLRRISAEAKRINPNSHLQVVRPGMLAAPVMTPEDCLVKKDDQKKQFDLLAARVRALPARQKELIVLRFYEGLSYEEIVEKTGLTHRSVYNGIHEALKKLKLEMPSREDFYGTAMSWISLTLLLAIE